MKKKQQQKPSEKKDIVVTFRLSSSEFTPYEKLIKKSGMSRSGLMREVVIARSDNVSLPKQQNPDSKRMLFLANKASNNINQMAKKLNNAHKKGVVNDSIYKTILNNLINIERSFYNAIDKC